MGRVIIVGDVHIDKKGGERHKRFSFFLDYVRSQKPEALLLAGDMFEFLHGKGTWVYNAYSDIFKKMEDISRSGTKIFYVYGNHDFDFELPYPFIRSADSFNNLELAGLKINFRHGDGVDPLDTKYHFLKKVLRSKSFKLLASLTPAFILYSLASFFSSLSRRSDSNPSFLIKRSNAYKEYAFTVLKNDNPDVVVYGHTHIPQLCQLNGSKQLYINPGFFGKDSSYATLDTVSGVYIGIFSKGC